MLNVSKQTVFKLKNEKINIIIKYFFFCFLFLLSFINNVMLSGWLIFITLFLTCVKKSQGAIIAFLWIQLRSLMNPGIAVSISSVAILKWLCIFYLSIYLLVLFRYKSRAYLKILPYFVFFALYLVIVQFFVSSYPIVSLFKIIAWIIPFLAIVKGITANSAINWIYMINRLLGILIFGSLLTIPFNFAYLRNGHALQGLLNHPNMFGIVIVLFLAGWMFEHKNKLSLATIVVAGLSFILIYLSESRTSLISAVILCFAYIFFSNIRCGIKIIILILLLIAGLFIIFTENSIKNIIVEFLLKGGTGFSDIVNSREDQISANISRYLENPILGTGFSVPYVKGVISYSFSFDLIVENGNIIFALLGDIGILGSLFFLFCYARILFLGKPSSFVLFLAPFLICLGEMVFFSTNNLAPLLYMFFAIYMSKSKNKSEI